MESGAFAPKSIAPFSIIFSNTLNFKGVNIWSKGLSAEFLKWNLPVNGLDLYIHVGESFQD